MAPGRAEQLFEPAALGPVMLRNRIIKAATFEDPSSRPGLRVLGPGC